MKKLSQAVIVISLMMVGSYAFAEDAEDIYCPPIFSPGSNYTSGASVPLGGITPPAPWTFTAKSTFKVPLTPPTSIAWSLSLGSSGVLWSFKCTVISTSPSLNPAAAGTAVYSNYDLSHWKCSIDGDHFHCTSNF